MLSTNTTLVLGAIFVLLAAACVWLILESTSRGSSRERSGCFIAAHRFAGYTFIALFCVMVYYMGSRLRSDAPTSGSATIHLTLALVLAPLIFLKVLLARRYRTQSAVLMPLGGLIFVLSFVIVSITAWPYL